MVEKALAFAAQVDEGLLRRTNLPSNRIRRLLDSLATVAGANGSDSAARINQLRDRFGEGSEYQLTHIQDLLVRRRRARPQPA